MIRASAGGGIKAWSWRRPLVAMPAMTLIVGLLLVFFGERIEKRNGLGFDGSRYAAWARDLPEAISAGLPRYHVGRILPSAMAYATLVTLRIPRTDEAIVRCFQAWNLAWLVIAATLWPFIARQLRVSRRGTWLGFVLFFVNFALLKFSLYYPVLCDTAAVGISTILLWAWLENRTVGLVVSTIMGAFCWPVLALVGSILIALPRGASPPRGRAAWSRVLLPAVLGLAFLWLVYADYFSLAGVARKGTGIASSLVYASTAIACAQVVCGAAFLVAHPWLESPLDCLRFFAARRILGRIALAAVVFAVTQGVTHVLSNGESGRTLRIYLDEAALEALAVPGIAIVAHAVYFGPVVLLAILEWKSVSSAARNLGLGATIALLAIVLQSVGSESRVIVNYLPFLAAFTMKATRPLWRRPWSLAIALALCVIYSKIWFPINAGLLGTWNQSYSTSQGPWMSRTAYVVQGIIVGLTMLGLAWFLRVSRRHPRHFAGSVETNSAPRATQADSASDRTSPWDSTNT